MRKHTQCRCHKHVATNTRPVLYKKMLLRTSDLDNYRILLSSIVIQLIAACFHGYSANKSRCSMAFHCADSSESTVNMWFMCSAHQTHWLHCNILPVCITHSMMGTVVPNHKISQMEIISLRLSFQHVHSTHI